MAETPKTNARIEELRSRLAGDPKSRLFYPLAEELRKVGAFEDAEKVLRSGLAVHGSYLSAWISLGRVLKELGKYQEGIEILNRVMTLDPGNVVAARLLAESHLAAGDRIEAVKKYKLVRALHPADDELEELIDRLEGDIQATSQVETERVSIEAKTAESGGKAAEESGIAAPTAREVREGAPVEGESEGGRELLDRMEPPEEEPFGTTEPPTSAPFTPSVAGRGPEEVSPFDEASEEPFDRTSPLPVLERGPFASSPEVLQAMPPIPRTSADIVGRGRNKSKIEKLERWLSKIRSA